MKLARGVWPVAAAFALGIAGLFVPGPAGDVFAFVWLGAFPGLALARLFLPGAPAATRWTLGLALSPLAATLAGWALLRAGQPLVISARLVALGGWLLFAGGEARALVGRGDTSEDAPADRAAWGWSLAAAAFVALPMLVNAWTRMRSDSWVHAGIVWEIVERGIPPQDPRFAGLPLNYVWFYNLFLALLGALRTGSSPFTHMATANACWIGVLLWLGWQMAWMLWRDRDAARPALPLLLVGLNAGALLLWPLWFLRALRGEVTGMPEVRRILANTRWASADVIHQLCAPFAWMVNAWDKFTVGTALGYAYLLMLVVLWAAMRWLGGAPSEPNPAAPARWRWLLVAGTASAGTVLFHSVVGLSVIPVGIGASLLLALLAPRIRALGTARRPLVLGIALAAGLAASWPYFRSISSGWDPSRSGVHHHYLHLDWRMPWTLLTACGLTAWMARLGIRRTLQDPNPASAWLLAWGAGMTLFALVVALPLGNEHKFVWQVFVPLALFGAPGMSGMLASWRRRLGPVLTGVLVFVALGLPSLLFLRGYLMDPAGAQAPETARTPGEPELYAWIRTHTPIDAVFLDDRSRDVLLVEGRRRLFVGTAFGPDKAAFPADELAHRREVSASLYGGAGARLAADVACLDSLAAPVYVLYRPDAAAASEPRPAWAAVEADSATFERVYEDVQGHRVYRLRTP